ncbi:sugar porter family MFS transporter [Haoranjiania flava]|uniref:Sugar porter family MFS transporter n=1 Tax=Haoranjiania flava TaxID=1856322 RepID=A0AAE3LKW3_9BACT|nr:sugar porter family MFS transporter [Haoranjiania flava]MCU7695008.1 sugar porter family MFS transporter [Haoranjiania flava]
MYAYNKSYIIRMAFISALGGYLFGFDFAVIAGALPFLADQFALNEYWEGFLTASLALGCIAGCLFAGAFSDKVGRKKALMAAAFIFLVSSLAMGFSTGRDVFIFARFVAGVGVGMASVLSPMYIAEISPASMRGQMVSINQLTVTIGIFITSLVNYALRDAGDDAWRWMVGLGAVPSFLFLIGVIWLPESPRWLVTKKREKDAAIILHKIGGELYAVKSVSSIQDTLQGEDTKKVSFKEVFSRAALPAIIIGMGLAVFQQWSGANAIFNYGAKIFESIGFSLGAQLKQLVIINAVNLIFTLIAMWQVDKLGRKPLMLFGALGLCVSYIISAILLQQGLSVAVWPLLAAIAIYAMTLAPVTWVVISEIFPNKVRGKATSIAVVALWMAYAVLVFTFPILVEKTGTYTPFYIYAGICLLGFIFVKLRVKETKGKTLEELENVMTRH